MAKPKLLIFGHSHLGALERAFNGRNPPVRFECHVQFVQLRSERFDPNFENALLPEIIASSASQNKFVERLNGRKTPDWTTSSWWRFLAKPVQNRMANIIARRSPDVVVSICMGNEYNALAMVRRPEPFDFDVPGFDVPRDPNATLIPYAMMRSHLKHLAEQNALLFWRFLRKTYQGPAILVAPPPPIESEEHILAHPSVFADLGKERGISPASFRLKMYRTYCLALREVALETGGHYFDPPESVFDNGYLAKPFWQDDPTHGNREYGIEVLRSLVTEVQKVKEAA